MSEEKPRTLRDKIILDHNPLYRQPIAYVAVLIPLAIAIVFFCRSGYGHLDVFNAAAQANFLSKAKLPLIILGLSTILLSIVVNTHRTIQTSKQIEVTEVKNRGDYFLNHYKMCLENISHIERQIDLKTAVSETGKSTPPTNERPLRITLKHQNLNMLYDKFFPNNSLGEGIKSLIPTDLCTPLVSLILNSMKIGHDQENYDKLLTGFEYYKKNSISTTSTNDDDNNINLKFTPEEAKKYKMEGFTGAEVLEEVLNDFHSKFRHFRTRYFSFEKIELDGKEVGNSLYKILAGKDEEISIELNSKIFLTHGMIVNYINLQVAMGGIEGRERAMYYAGMFAKYLTSIHLIVYPEDDHLLEVFY